MRLGSLILVLSLPAFAGPNPSLEKAAKALGELNYVEANRAVDAALKLPGNDRETLLKIFELQAIVLATLNQSARATQVFEQLLSLNPGFALTGNHPPRVSTAFYEARAWAEKQGALEARPLDALLEPGNVKAVRVEVTKDPAKLVKKVRFHFAGAQVVSPVVAGIASAAPKPPAAEVSWWAQLLGDRDAVLTEVASAAEPRKETAPPKPVVEKAPEKPQPVAQAPAQPPPDAPVVTPPPPVPPPEPAAPPRVKAQARSQPISTGRIAAVGLIGAGAICAGLGIGFGVMANGTRAQVDNAPTNSAGQVTNMTQRQALELDGKQRFQATASNAFFISAGALAVGGAALFFLSGSNDTLAIIPTGPGIAVAGTLPSGW
ncbi:MAG: uncharacterized protein H6Q89_3970 [Myxococcaceae bacterium]|nr:uncharacterized protein [Myxococcaceae bacterium]